MKIGVTSQNFRTITGHAGKTRRFLIYGDQPGDSISEIGRLDLPKEMAMHEFRGDRHPLDDLDALDHRKLRTRLRAPLGRQRGSCRRDR